MNETNYEDDDFYDGPSKSQIKRELLAITELGKQVIELPIEKIKQLPLDEKLLDAIKVCQKIKTRGEGRRRQVQYVGKLMRHADIEAIRKQLDTWENGSKEATAQMHQLETLRDRLIASDDELTILLNTYPEIDVQPLRALIRAARKEITHNTTLAEGQEPQKKNYRALFQFLKPFVMQS
ncbi:ribosome-associated protein [Pelistega sp. NLN82]|uniref:Dual-action ribosomal maturation protein DarP n=1 Tax=Pelistega ratti TaxID=2652177 RepID=A0A6L9Y4L7_9BURK|nr:ribosome biogenesis factor YjgA [Pelistega ratti]NEN75341.1 ribosome-associated protein [Pelistega ratti]